MLDGQCRLIGILAALVHVRAISSSTKVFLQRRIFACGALRECRFRSNRRTHLKCTAIARVTLSHARPASKRSFTCPGPPVVATPQCVETASTIREDDALPVGQALADALGLSPAAVCVRRSETRPVGRSESDPPEGGSFYALLI